MLVGIYNPDPYNGGFAIHEKAEWDCKSGLTGPKQRIDPQLIILVYLAGLKSISWQLEQLSFLMSQKGSGLLRQVMAEKTCSYIPPG
jgi:hypothetical protein